MYTRLTMNVRSRDGSPNREDGLCNSYCRQPSNRIDVEQMEAASKLYSVWTCCCARDKLPSFHMGKMRILDRDERARAAIRRYEEEGLPFVLYLRDYGWEKWVGPRGQHQAQHESIYNAVVRALPAGCGFVLIQDQESHVEAFLSPFKPPHDPAPGLLLDHDTWQEVVRMAHSARVLNHLPIDSDRERHRMGAARNHQCGPAA